MRSRIVAGISVLLCLVLTTVADAEVAVPPTLSDWTGWVQHQQEFRACPLMLGETGESAEAFLCAWPGNLQIDADANGARFAQTWTVHATSAVPLPGDDQHWPLAVEVDGQAMPVVNHPETDNPVLWLKPGTHRVIGVLRWKERPASIALDAAVALVTLNVDGKPVFPIQRDASALWLGRAEVSVREADSLDVQVFRLLHDVIPQRLVTVVRLKVSGKGREETLSQVLPADFVPVALSGGLTARYEADGSLHVQVRPGTHELVLTARATRPLAALTIPAARSPWPKQEVWSYQPMPSLRVTDVSGAAQIDPNLAEVPTDWRNMPAFEMTVDSRLDVNQRSRGLSAQDQNRLSLNRELWLDYAGGGWTGKDQISGSLLRDWRLDLKPPYQLRRADENGFALLVTAGAERNWTGVEVRERNLQLSASTRLSVVSGALPLTGWQHPFESVSTLLHLPPAYELIAAPGADRAPESWLDRWNLLDVFIAALIGFLCALTFGRLAALIPVAYLLLAWHLPGAPKLSLLAAVGLALATAELVRNQRLARWLKRASQLAALVLVVMALPFVADQIRQALYPQLEAAGEYVYAADYAPGKSAAMGSLEQEREKSDGSLPEEVVFDEALPVAAEAPPPPASAASASDAPQTLDSVQVTGTRIDGGDKAAPRRENVAAVASLPEPKPKLLKRYASNTIVQAGAGEPGWQWRDYRIEVAGPVLPTQTVRLLLSPPWLTRLARLAIVALLALTLLRLMKMGFGLRLPLPGRLGSVLLLSLMATGAVLAAAVPDAALARPSMDSAAETPSQSLLDELGRRLRELPDCTPSCGRIASAEVHAEGNRLTAVLVLHAAEPIALPLPGNESLLGLTDVTLDGLAVNALVRGDDGSQWIALARGVHRAEIQWRMAAADAISLRFSEPPAHVQFQGEGWTASGIDDGTLATGSLDLTRTLAAGAGDRAGVAQSFPPYVIVTRELRFDLDWTIHTAVQRIAPSTSAFSVTVPLLADEHVLGTGFQIENGALTAAFGEHQEWVQWESRLDAVDALQITAPDQINRSEIWRLDVSPTWNVQPQGVPGVHPDSGMYQFHPLPGEVLTMAVTRPQAVTGSTLAIDQATLSSMIGKRSSEQVLNVVLRATQGGQHVLDLPETAEVMAVEINGQLVNVRPLQGYLSLPVTPGMNRIQIRWRDAQGAGLRVSTPTVGLNAAASNLRLNMSLPEERWLIATSGPRLGPAVLYWGELLVMLLLAAGLSRSGRTPLKLRDWMLLGIGFSTVSWWALLWFVAWLFALDARARLATTDLRWRFNLLQIGLVALSLVAGMALFQAISSGLLGSPDLHVTGFGSSAHDLHWFDDQSASALPTATAISLPMWLYRALMLAWAFWLAWALIRWLRWALQCFVQGGAWQPWRPARPVLSAPVVVETVAATESTRSSET